jgi:hypothetical protein
MVLGDEIAPICNDTRVRTAATLIGDRKKSQQGGEEQSAGKEACQDFGKMLSLRGFGYGNEWMPEIEIH